MTVPRIGRWFGHPGVMQIPERRVAMVMMVSAALCASFAFMLPVATPPNAIVFGSHCIRISQMIRAGIWLNLVGVVLITGFVYFRGGSIGEW